VADKANLTVFEAKLDTALASLPSRSWSNSRVLRDASELYEVVASTSGSGAADWIARGISILASDLVIHRAGTFEVQADGDYFDQLAKDIEFASHYYMIREYLYYSYNVNDSMSWEFDGNHVEVRFKDESIPRQFFTVSNDHILQSRYHFRDFNEADEILRLLKNEPEGVVTPNSEAADVLMRKEVDLKLEAYFSLIASSSQINLGDYTYAQFLSVYRLLLLKSLYHRYLARAQGAVGVIYMPQVELTRAIEEELGVPVDAAERILKDLVYDAGAVGDRVDATYFSLVRDGAESGDIMMRPHHFATSEGLVNLLRVIAQRRPKTFLDQVSNEIGSAFVRRVKANWESQGFQCFSEISLAHIDQALPDIDLLVISREPTLGYVLYVCELKCPLPPRWAKDQLKVLNKDGVSKAFRQVEALKKFIRTEEGIKFIAKYVASGDHPHFDDFVVVIDHLIITSDNAGMFFAGEAVKVINFRTLERLLRRSDGDMALIQYVLSSYPEWADDAMKKVMVEFQVGDLTVAYEAVADGLLLEFPQGEWQSSPKRQEMIDDFIAEGGRPSDVLGVRMPDAMVLDRRKLDAE